MKFFLRFTPYSPVDCYKNFGETYCLYLLSWNVGSRFLRNDGSNVPDCTFHMPEDSNVHRERLKASALAGDCDICKPCKLGFIEVKSVTIAFRIWGILRCFAASSLDLILEVSATACMLLSCTHLFCIIDVYLFKVACVYGVKHSYSEYHSKELPLHIHWWPLW